MLEKLYRAIRGDAPAQEITLGGRSYTTSDVEPVLHPTPDIIRVKTLTALVDYLKANVDALDITSLICHVESPHTVSIQSALAKAEADKAALVEALEEMMKAYEMILPGVAKIAIPDYALMNDAPCTARAALARVKGEV